MTVKAKKKAFKDMRRGEQILHILFKHGPKTTWELVDHYRNVHKEDVAWENLRKVLITLRKNGKAGIVNYKPESKRQKLSSWQTRYDYRTGKYKSPNGYGRKVGGSQYVEVWGALREE